MKPNEPTNSCGGHPGGRNVEHILAVRALTHADQPGIDWDELYRHRREIADILSYEDDLLPGQTLALEGVLSMLDWLQDLACEAGVFTYPQDPEVDTELDTGAAGDTA